MRSMLDAVRTNMKGVLNQYHLISICLAELQTLKGDDWISSFRKVNMHPDHKVSFDVIYKLVFGLLIKLFWGGQFSGSFGS